MLNGPQKLLVGGISAALIVLVVGYVAVTIFSRHVNSLQGKCAAEAKKDLPPPPPGFTLDVDCDPQSLLMHESVGVQAELASAQRQLNFWRENPQWIAGLLVAIAALPLCWYFLLERIRELSNAIRGR